MNLITQHKAYRLIALLGFLFISACQSVPVASKSPTQERINDKDSIKIPTIAASQILSLKDFFPALIKNRVVFVGESHDQYHHHLSQLAIIKGLHSNNPNMAIGLEFFQQPFQKHLDAYIAGEINEQAMLEKTEYFTRWVFDYRLYQPILKFAQKNKIPLIALNLPQEITKKVGKKGLSALNDQERVQIPESIDRNVPGYRKALETIFQRHGDMGDRNIENFIDVQLLWDEGMAENAANYLKTHPQKNLVVLAGTGHIAKGTGIPQRLKRRINVEMASVIPGDSIDINKNVADYILFPETQSLPDNGRIGIMLEPVENGMKVESFSKTSKAEEAGIKKSDIVIEIEQRKINTIADVRLALWNKLAGEKVSVVLIRNEESQNNQRIELTIELK